VSYRPIGHYRALNIGTRPGAQIPHYPPAREEERSYLKTVRRLSVIVLVLLGIIVIPSMVLASGVGVTPGKLEFSVRPGGKSTQDLQVFNQSDQISKFQLYVEGFDETWFEISPAEFTLNPHEIKTVQVAFTPSITAAPENTTIQLCIVSLPQDADLRIGTGIKLKTTVTITELPIMTIQWWIVSTAIAGIVVIGTGLFFLIRRRRRTANA
jgi:hypothetical protein